MRVQRPRFTLFLWPKVERPGRLLGRIYAASLGYDLKRNDVTQSGRLVTGRGRTPRRVFLGEQGIGAGGSLLLSGAIFQVLESGAIAALSHVVSLEPMGPIPPTPALIRESCEVLVVLGATWVVARIEKRPLFSFGYAGGDKMLRLVSGALWGFTILSVLIGVVRKSGWLVFDGRSLSGLTALRYAFIWGLVFLLVGVFEESLLRCYLQYTLARGIGYW